MKYTVLQPIAFSGERRERGSVVEMDEVLAQSFGPEYVALFVEAAATAPVEAETATSGEAEVGADVVTSGEQQGEGSDEAAAATAPARRKNRAGR